MNPTMHKATKKALILIITLLFLFNVCVSSCVFAAAITTAEKIQYQEKQDAAYSSSQLIQREINNREAVEYKNDVINKGPSVVGSKITNILETAGTDKDNGTAKSKKLMDFINKELVLTGAGDGKNKIDISKIVNTRIQDILKKGKDLSESKELVLEELAERIIKQEPENEQGGSPQDAAAKPKDTDKAINVDYFIRQPQETADNRAREERFNGKDIPNSKELIEFGREELMGREEEDTDDELDRSKNTDKMIKDFIRQQEVDERARAEQARSNEPSRTIIWVADHSVVDAVKPIVYLIAETILDTNNDGQINEADQGAEDLGRIFEPHKNHCTYYCENNENSHDIYSIEDQGMRDLLGKLLVWAMQNSGNEAISLYIGDGIKIEFSQFSNDGGDNERLTLRSKDWQITITHHVPNRGVDTETSKNIREAFRDFENAKNRLKNAPNKEDATLASFKAGDKKAGQETISYKPYFQKDKVPIIKVKDSVYMYTANTKLNHHEEKAARSNSNNKTILNVGDKKNISETAPTKETNQKEVTMPNAGVDHAAVVKGEWDEAKSTLINVFERVLAEDPGAVYSGGNGSINAIILLTSAVAPNNKNNKDNEGKKAKNS